MRKMSYLLCAFVLFMIPSFVFAKELEQKNEIVFTGDFDYLYDAVEDHEHNFIVVREKNTSTSNDYYLTKVNSSGEVIWSNKTDYTMSNVSLAVDSNNNIYFLASVDSPEDVSVCSSVYVEKTKIVKYEIFLSI